MSVTCGILFSYASIIFGEFYFSECKGVSRNSHNKAPVKIKHSRVCPPSRGFIVCTKPNWSL